MKYWINIVSQDHVMVGKERGFVQAGHGKKTTLKKLQPGDYIIFYSPKTSLQNGKPVQAFTAVSTIKDQNIYQVVVSDRFQPYRRNAEYENCQEVQIKPLIEQLEFITNKQHWGFRFRLGLFEINQHDFELIYGLMKVWDNSSN
jgi:predicted RNA-binding protein